MNKTLKLLLSIALCEGVGILGSIFTVRSVNTWYLTLNKPFFNPPPWIFGPVWTVLYILMGISLFYASEKKNLSLHWFWIQLALNFFWSIAFFGLKNPLLALIVLIALWISIFFTIKGFWKKSRISSKLLFPYIAWVTFAGILNLSLVLLN